MTWSSAKSGKVSCNNLHFNSKNLTQYPKVSIAEAHTILGPMSVGKGVQLTVASKLPSRFLIAEDMLNNSPYDPRIMKLLIFLKQKQQTTVFFFNKMTQKSILCNVELWSTHFVVVLNRYILQLFHYII